MQGAAAGVGTACTWACTLYWITRQPQPDVHCCITCSQRSVPPALASRGLLSLNAFVINIGFCQWCNTAPPALGIQHIPQPKQQGWQLPTVPLEEQVGPCLWCICCLTSSWRSALSAWDRSPCTSICTSLRRVSASVALN